MIVLGVDPGLDGALAWLDTETGLLLGVMDMPVVEVRTGRSKRREAVPEIIAQAIRDGLDGLAGLPARAYVEEVHAMPKQGVSSTFKLGITTGIVRGVLAGLGIPADRVAPIAWKRAVGLKAGAEKGESRARACALWPDKADLFRRVRDDGRAEAALIAWACVCNRA